MNIACMTDNAYLSTQVERALAPLSKRFAVYRSIAALARGLDQESHDVILLAGENDLIEQFLSCRLPATDSERPMIVLLSDQDCGAEVDRALASGIDDYVSIASGLSQLETRIRAWARRRAKVVAGDVITAGDIALDRRDGSARLHGLSVDLTQREFLLAWFLFRSLGRVVTVQRLAEAVWGSSSEVAKRTIEQHVYRLRCKLSLAETGSLILTTVYGRGYRLDECSWCSHATAPPVRATAPDSEFPADMQTQCDDTTGAQQTQRLPT
jgi:DNA-binding response OmpR family regulator